MNYGLPVIASENIEHEIIGDAGLIYRNNDPNELAEKIIYLFENEKERKKLSHNAKKKIVDYYPERIVPKVEDLYNYIVR
jgi:glycosyltransferase involved in cell wall biosynthesis